MIAYLLFTGLVLGTAYAAVISLPLYRASYRGEKVAWNGSGGVDKGGSSVDMGRRLAWHRSYGYLLCMV